MSLTYPSGFFPFPVLPVAQFGSTFFPTDKLDGFSLDTLTRIYWLWKKCVITANIPYSFLYEPGVTATGTILGSVTITLPLLPQQRAVNFFQDVYRAPGFLCNFSTQSTIAGGLVDSGVLSSLGGGSSPYSHSCSYANVPNPFTASFGINWPTDITSSKGIDQYFVVQKTPTDFLSYFNFWMYGANGLVINNPANHSAGGVTGCNMIFRVPFGDPDIVAPLATFSSNGSVANPAISISGSILINFTDFWTP